MRATVIFEDNSIGINGFFKLFDSVTPTDANWRVIQWYGSYGTIEVHKGDRIWIEDISFVQPYIDQWNSMQIEVAPEVVQNSGQPQNGPSVIA